MTRPNKDRLPTRAPESGLFQAFAGLEIGNLPAGPADEPPKAKGAPDKPAKLGRVVLRKETAHRGGKCVIVVDGFDPALDEAFLNALSKRLRTACGCGGAVKARTIEIQGDQAARIRVLLTGEGFRVAGI